MDMHSGGGSPGPRPIFSLYCYGRNGKTATPAVSGLSQNHTTLYGVLTTCLDHYVSKQRLIRTGVSATNVGSNEVIFLALIFCGLIR